MYISIKDCTVSIWVEYLNAFSNNSFSAKLQVLCSRENILPEYFLNNLFKHNHLKVIKQSNL